jgi:hypothetical protein
MRRTMPGEILNGTSIKYYGVLEVLDKSSSKSK